MSTISQDILSIVFYAKELQPDYVANFNRWNELITNYIMNEEKTKKYKLFLLIF